MFECTLKKHLIDDCSNNNDVWNVGNSKKHGFGFQIELILELSIFQHLAWVKSILPILATPQLLNVIQYSSRLAHEPDRGSFLFQIISHD